MDLDLPQEILLHIFSFLSLEGLGRICNVCKLFSSLSSTTDLWQRAYKLKWELPTEEKSTETCDLEFNWKSYYKTKLRLDKESQLQKVCAASLKYQSRLALLLSRKREIDYAVQYFHIKKAKMASPSQPSEKGPTLPLSETGWHPAEVQQHFQRTAATATATQTTTTSTTTTTTTTTPKLPFETSQNRAMERLMVKKTKFAEQLLEKFTELSRESEQRKQELSLELKKFGV